MSVIEEIRNRNEGGNGYSYDEVRADVTDLLGLLEKIDSVLSARITRQKESEVENERFMEEAERESNNEMWEYHEGKLDQTIAVRQAYEGIKAIYS